MFQPIKREVWKRYQKQVDESEGFDVDYFPELGEIGTVITPVPCEEAYVESLMEAIEEHNQLRRAEGRPPISLVRPIKFNVQFDPTNLYCTFVVDADGAERTYQAKLFQAVNKLHTIFFREISSSGLITYLFYTRDDPSVADRRQINGKPVEIKRTMPKKYSNPPPAFASEPRGRPFSGGVGRYGSSYAEFGGGEFGPSYRTPGGLGPRLGEYGGYGRGTGEFGGGYGGFGSGLGGYRGDSSLGYSSRFGSYGALGGGYGRDEGFVRYVGSSYGSGYDSGTGSSFGSSALYGGRGGGYGGGAGPSGGYHPYAR